MEFKEEQNQERAKWEADRNGKGRCWMNLREYFRMQELVTQLGDTLNDQNKNALQ